MVIWGKGKDYDIPPPHEAQKIDTQIQLQEQEKDPNNNFQGLQINRDHIHV